MASSGVPERFSGNSIPSVETPPRFFPFAPGDPAVKMPSMSPRVAFHLRSALLALTILFAPASHAEEGGGMQAAIARVERENDGKVLAVQTLERNKRKIYLIKVLTRDGRVKVVQVRAND